MQPVEIAARTLLGEDNNPEGWTAIAWVIRNRMQRFNKPIVEVCTAPYQFSCWLNDKADHANFVRLLTDESDYYKHCEIIVKSVMSDTIPDPTNGATHYHSVGIDTDTRRPYWTSTMTRIGQFGNNVFYK